MDNIDIFDRKFKSVQEIIDDGVQSELLRNNDVFRKAVNTVYNNLVLSEDKLTNDPKIDGRRASEMRKTYSLMRALLSDVVLELDGNITEGKNAELNKENL